MKKLAFSFVALAGLLFTSCDSDDNGSDDMPIEASCDDGIMNGDETGVDCGGSNCTPCETAIENPESYSFERDGESTVSFSGQTTRLLMGDEILGAFNDVSATAEQIQAMYAHQEGANDFENADLNASDKSISSKTAASADYFSSNATDQG